MSQLKKGLANTITNAVSKQTPQGACQVPSGAGQPASAQALSKVIEGIGPGLSKVYQP